MLNKSNLEQIIKKSGFYIKVRKQENKVFFILPKNIFLKLNEDMILYEVEEDGLSVSTNTEKIKKECPKYAIRSIICIDLLYRLSERQLSIDLLSVDDKITSFKNIQIGELSKESDKLLNCVIDILNEIPLKKVPEDIKEGLEIVVNVINSRGVR